MVSSGWTPTGDTAGERPTVFLRKASGVVKAFSPLDSFIYNTLANSVLCIGAIPFILIPYALPGSNIPIGIILTGVVVAFGGITYSMLQAAMPRSGGDYVLLSRIFSGSIGFVLTFAAYVIIGGLWLGLNGWLFSNVIVGPFMLVLGAFWNIQFLKDFAAWLIAPSGIFIGGILTIVWIVFMCSVGFTTYAKVQKWFFWVGTAATIVLLAFVTLNTNESFVTNFNAFMSQNFGVADAYSTTIANAKAAGSSPNFAFSWGETAAVIPAGMFMLLWAMWGTGNAGEIRDKGTVRSKSWQMLGCLAFTTALGAWVGYLMMSRMGTEFLSSASYLYYNAPDQTVIPVAPFFAFFAAAFSTNAVLTIIAFLALFVYWWVGIPDAMVYASRVVLAMSIDRSIPSWFGRVNSRTHTPLNAVLSIGALGVVFCVLYSYTDWFWKLSLSGGLMTLISIALVSFAGALWPYIKPELFNASPIAKYKLGTIPIITITGLLLDIGAAYTFWQYITVPVWGIAATTGYVFNIGIIVLGAVVYFAFKAYRKSRESLDLALVYREIPPE